MSTAPAATHAPWFRERPAAALAVAGTLYVAVFVLRMLAGDPVDAYSMLYVLPVALVATAFGARAGVGAGALALALVLVWSLTQDVSLSAGGWATRAVPLLLLGYLLGDASDRLQRAAEETRVLEGAALRHREAIEINDSLVQGMVAAKWALEAGRLDLALSTLDETIARAQQLVSALIREAGMGSRAETLLADDHPEGIA